MAENAPPGWYQAETDAPGTERYWDGSQWSTETRAVTAAPPLASRANPIVNGRELATPWSRIGARLLDTVFLLIILFPVAIVIGLNDVTVANLSVRDIGDGAEYVALGLIAVAYEILFTALRSATPGKMIVGIEIMRKSDGGTPLGFGPAGMRWLPGALTYLNQNLGGLLGLVSLILLFVDKERRTVNDFVAQTLVVRKQR